MHSCTQCSYTSNKRYNLERHIGTVHIEQPNILSQVYKCPHCYVVCASKRNLNLHIQGCKHLDDPQQCPKCRKIFASRSSKSRHIKICQATSQEIVVASDATHGSSITTQNNINTQNNTQIQTQNNNCVTNNNIVVLKFPDVDEDFDFLRDHITAAKFQKLFDCSRPEIGFRRFSAAILDREENRIIKKIDAKANHSMIHKGDGEWDLDLDKDVFQRLAFDLSVCALGAYNDNKQKARLVKTSTDRIFKYLDAVNTENDPEYTEAVQRLKLIVVNMTKKWEAEVKD